MNPRRKTASALSLAAVALTLVAAGALPAAAQAASPAFSIVSIESPSRFVAGDTSGTSLYLIDVKNIGAAPSDGTPITITDTLPSGVTLSASASPLLSFALGGDQEALEPSLCDPTPPLSCSTPVSPIHGGGGTEFDSVLKPGGQLVMAIPVDIAPGLDGGTAVNHATVSGGGAAPVSTTSQTPVSADPAPFGFQGDVRSSFTDAAGNPATQAGSHPYNFNTSFLLNTVFDPVHFNPPAGSLKDVRVELPKGVVVNPGATPVRCTEAELETTPNGSPNGCSDAAAVGLVYPFFGAFGFANPNLSNPIYNMVPPPGAPAELAFSVIVTGIQIVVHVRGGVDTAGDYRLTADANDLIQLEQPLGADVDLWGNPSDPVHDSRRGQCSGGVAPTFGFTCPVAPTDTPLLTMPSACSGPLQTSFSADSWEDPGNFITATTQTLDSAGSPVGVSGCASLDFAPTLKARPTTNLADSPSGLDVDLQIPQTNSLGQRATANLKKAVVTLPEGLVVNPSGANGLGACSSSQIGLTTPIGSTPIHFSGAHPSCPDAARIGTVEVDTPLLDDPLPGAVYIAKPHDNPFDSLLAIYVVVDDPATGIVVKLAGHVVPDPVTGRLTTTFDDNPQLPFGEFKLNFFGGANGTLRTPPTCGAYSTTSELSPWSGTQAQTPHDDYTIDSSPSGGNCPTTEGEQPNAPSFDAGTVSPIAGAFSPFVLNLRRDDGSQQFSTITTTPPPGLVAKLAGTLRCLDGDLDAAAPEVGRRRDGEPELPGRQPGRHGRTSPPAPAPTPTTPRARSTWPAPTTARRCRWRSSPRPWRAPSTSAPSSSASPSTSTRQRPRSPRSATRSQASSRASRSTSARPRCASTSRTSPSTGPAAIRAR